MNNMIKSYLDGNCTATELVVNTLKFSDELLDDESFPDDDDVKDCLREFVYYCSAAHVAVSYAALKRARDWLIRRHGSGEEERKQAADKWAIRASKKIYGGTTKRALAVLLFDQNTRHWLAVHQPMSLKQAQQALDGHDYVEWL